MADDTSPQSSSAPFGAAPKMVIGVDGKPMQVVYETGKPNQPNQSVELPTSPGEHLKGNEVLLVGQGRVINTQDHPLFMWYDGHEVRVSPRQILENMEGSKIVKMERGLRFVPYPA
jgi:hypothetical protein